jgi:hypothetical protein
MQKVGYAYDFATKKILDPLTLSVALKQLTCLDSAAINDVKCVQLIEIRG